MKIVERYGAGYRILTGRGAWGALLPARALLAGLYWIGAALHARRRPPRVRRSSRGPGAADPVVVSIGNLEAGGGGKTPCAIALARGIAGRGGSPSWSREATAGRRGAARRASFRPRRRRRPLAQAAS